MTDPWSELTKEELVELVGLAGSWAAAHEALDFAAADVLRAELMAWGAWPPEHGWHPVFESPDHRKARLSRRWS